MSNIDSCEVIEKNKQVELAFEKLRKGYPDKPLNEQCQGKEFRKNAKIILKSLAAHTLQGINPDRVVVLMPWRAGLAFGQNYMAQGVNKFYHVSSQRHEKTLKTMVDYEVGKIDSNNVVIVSDPMLATGNTLADAVERVVRKGVLQKNIIINALIAAPEGIQKIKKLYPKVRIIIGALDKKLDNHGYIVPGLGDFGDKYFADLSSQELKKIIDQFNLNDTGRQKIISRIQK